MSAAALVLFGSAALVGYAYVGYPALLWLLARRRAPAVRRPLPPDCPSVSIVIPAFNEAAAIRGTLDGILSADYPADKRQVLVVSDASTDATDDVVREYAGRGVELVRRPRREGKTAGENAAVPLLTGEIVINTDASVRIHPDAIRALVGALTDSGVGVASARDVSIRAGIGNSAESSYVGYEMWVRSLETNVGGIVGASGCLYAVRADIHRHPVPDDLSRDFASALTARQMGYRAVSVPDAICFVPHTPSLQEEYRRKVRTIARGLATLAYKRALLNPVRYGGFAWRLASHKVCRWLVPWAGLAALGALGALAFQYAGARLVTAALAAGVLAVVSCYWLVGRALGGGLLRAVAFGLTGNSAVLHAWLWAVAGRKTPLWSPTRRPVSPAPASPQHHGNRPQHDVEVLHR